MSKMDGLRAMREARYAENAARAKSPATAEKQAPKKVAAKKSAANAGPASVADSVVTGELCGHRAISGRTCTREKGHAAKSHRYS